MVFLQRTSCRRVPGTALQRLPKEPCTVMKCKQTLPGVSEIQAKSGERVYFYSVFQIKQCVCLKVDQGNIFSPLVKLASVFLPFLSTEHFSVTLGMLMQAGSLLWRLRNVPAFRKEVLHLKSHLLITMIFKIKQKPWGKKENISHGFIIIGTYLC